MEASQVLGERSRWDRYMPVLANLLRPSTETGPVVEMSIPDSDEISESITAFRNSMDGESLKNWGDQIINMVFDGYVSWAGYYFTQPEWVLTSLAQVLEDTNQQTALLGHLQRIVDAFPEDRDECLRSFKNDIDQWMSGWQYNASMELANAQGPLLEGQERVEAYPNTDSWNYSRTPGTFYYKYVERNGGYVYVYNDDEEASDDEWHELNHWDEAAERLALGYGDLHENGWPEEWSGWYAVPVPPEYQQLYEGEWVYGRGTDGPWMSKREAERQTAPVAQQLAEEAARQVPAQETSASAPLLTQMAQDVRAVIAPFANELMAKLPPEMAGKPEVRLVVEQSIMKEAAEILATHGAQEGR
jgi:hypothetical protein